MKRIHPQLFKKSPEFMNPGSPSGIGVHDTNIADCHFVGAHVRGRGTGHTVRKTFRKKETDLETKT